MIHVKQLSIMVLIIIMAACKKEKTPAPTDDTITILQSGDWKLTAFTISPALNGITDVMQNIPPCAKDNLLQFKPNSIFYFDEGATKCDPSGPQRETGTWSYDPAIKQLKYASPSLDFVIDIKSINANSLNGTRIMTVNGANYTYTGTLTKQ